MQEPEIKRWTAKRKAELIRQMYKGQTSIEEAAPEYDLTPSEIERWMDDAKAGMENALKADPKDVAEQCEKQLSELKEAYGQAMLEVKFIKSCKAISRRLRTGSSVRRRDGLGRPTGIGGEGLSARRHAQANLLLPVEASGTSRQ